MNEQNLKANSERTPSERKALARKAGKASGKARREKKQFREAFEMLLEREIKDKQGNTLTGVEAIALKIFEKALKGDVKAYETIRDVTGQKPTEELYIEHHNDNTELAELLEALKGGDSNEDRT